MGCKRKQASTDYIGDGDTDLNQHLTLRIDLEKGFATDITMPSAQTRFKSGMKRIATADSRLSKRFQEARPGNPMNSAIAQVSLEDLEKVGAGNQSIIRLTTLLIWTEQSLADTGENTNWHTEPLIAAKKSQPVDDVKDALETSQRRNPRMETAR